jgi:hypothetical protein
MVTYQFPKTPGQLEDRIDPTFGTTTAGIKRYVIFTAREYSARNKKSLDSTIQERKTICSIGLYLPGNLAETLSQDWGMAMPFSLQALLKNAEGGVMNKVGEMLSGLIKTSTGQVLAPATELLYNGPGARSISFSYDFVPLDEDEEKEVKLILVAFKRWSSPASDLGRLLSVPPVWEIKMAGIDSNEKSEFLTWGFKDRMWALTNLDYNYSPDGNFSAFHSGFPVKVTLNLTFSELVPLWRQETDADAITMDRQVNEAVNGNE